MGPRARPRMSRFIAAALCAALLAASPVRCAAVEPAEEALEVHPRGGLPNFLSRIQAGLPVTLAFLGGSLTEQGGYVRRWVAALKKEFPRSKVTVVNAGVAGMSSSVGAFRVGETVMAARPDLVFVEFAVDDGDQPSAAPAILRAMEGIVRQVWQGSPLTDLCFVYHARPGAMGLEALQAGKLPQGAVAHEKVAEHYGIPSIHLALAAARRAREGKLKWAPASGAQTAAQVEGCLEEGRQRSMRGEGGEAPRPGPVSAQPLFTVDGVYPTEYGSQLSAEAIARGFAKLKALPVRAGPHELKPALDPENLQRARLVAPTEGAMSAGWKRMEMGGEPQWRWRTAAIRLWRAGAAGESVRFEFKGTEVSLWAVGGPGEGQVEIALDGVARILPLADRSTASHRVPGVVLLPIGRGLADAPHTVALKTLNPCAIGYFLVVGEPMGP